MSTAITPRPTIEEAAAIAAALTVARAQHSATAKSQRQRSRWGEKSRLFRQQPRAWGDCWA